METALQTVSPKDIQARVRAGASVEDVAAETGWPLDRVARYAGPPLDERAYVAERGRSVEIRASNGGATLAESALIVLEGAGLAGSIEWDAWRRADGKWVVSCTDDSGATACWTYESAGRTVHPLDERARWLMGVAPAEAARTASRTAEPARIPEPEPARIPEPEPVAPEPRPRLVAVPSEPPGTTNITEPVPGLTPNRPAVPQPAQPVQQPVQPAQPVQQPVQPAQPVQQPAAERAPEPARKPRGKSRRSSVPTWDEILFGAGKNED